MSDPVERHSEVRVAAEEGVMATVTELDVIEATGADAANYLHGQLSQNVERLTDGETRWTLLLQPQGKIDAWMRIHRVDPERFLLVVDSGFGPTAQTRLDRFKLRVDAAFNTTTRPALALRGPGSAELARTLASGSPVTVVAADWGGPGCDLVAEPGAESVIGELLAVLPESAVRGSARSLEMVRVLRGQPAMGSELDGSTIPAAAGVVEESVDFTKGCYVGQELVARVDSRGSNTPTNLVRLLLSAQSNELTAGLQLELDGTVIGTVTSVAPSATADQAVGLGYVKRGVEVPGSAHLIVDGRVVEVALRPLRN